MGSFQGSLVPSGSLLPVLASPGLGSREGFLSREGWEWEGSLQQDSKFCCLSCGAVHDCWDPLGLSAIDEVHGFRFRVFSSGVRVLVFSSGVPLLLFFAFGDEDEVLFSRD